MTQWIIVVCVGALMFVLDWLGVKDKAVYIGLFAILFFTMLEITIKDAVKQAILEARKVRI